MGHEVRQKVFYSDTDAYGVVWHGSYIKWLEMGRVLFSESKNCNLIELEKNNIIMPVVELNIKYKVPAKLNDEIVIHTKIKEIKKSFIIFEQYISNKKNNKIYVTADVKVVAVNKSGQLYRSLPEQLIKLSVND